AGMFESAKEFSEGMGTKEWGICVESDQYNTVSPEVQEFVLSSMLKRVDVSVYKVIESQVGSAFVAGNVVYDLSVDGVGYSTTGGFVDDIVDQIEEFKAAIIAGDIEVPTEP
ncbi:MAG: BMP family ABC transporter substrate-binding protein, partial [Acidimicrobiales bacterium]